MAMNKTIIIGGVVAGVVVVGAAVSGSIFAANMSSNMSSNNSVSTTQLQEKTKLNGWQQKSNDWYYYKDDTPGTGWIEDNNSWYYLDDSGKIKLNWVQDKNKWYYLGSDGKMRTGWIQDKGNWYYLNNDGTMAVNTTVGGNYINENGLIEETPKPKQSTNEGQTKSNKNDVLTMEDAKQMAVDYLNRKEGGSWENSYFASGTGGAKIMDKYNCYGFIPENQYGDDSDYCICVNKYTGQLYYYDYVHDKMKAIN